MIRRIREMILNVTSVCIAVVALSSLLIASYELETWPWKENLPLRAQYEFRTVRRTTISPIMSAPGRVESAKRTVVQCQLENLAGSNSTSGGASTILWLIPEGTQVKAGDVLARLDSSGYEEMLRQQTIVVEQAKASHLQARLNHEIALLAVKEYVEGTVQETEQQMEGNLAMAQSDLTRAETRLEWTKMMNKKGYASVAQIETDKQTVTSGTLALQRQLGTYDLFKRFTKPRTQKTLQGEVTTALTSLNSEYVKLQRQLERFATLTKQVDRCTIRAPHDGIIFYYKNSGRGGGGGPNSQSSPVEEGAVVQQNKKLFFLPDLSDMEIQVALNESVVNRIAPGMHAKVRFEALPDLVLDGEVTTVDQIPVQQKDNGEDVRYFWSIVKLDRSGAGLKPGMSAEVDVNLATREDVLAVPHEAVVSEQNRKVCFVPRGDHLERRDVQVGLGTTNWIEITGGLSEGDEVALNPPVWGGHPRSLSGFDDSIPWPSIDYSKVAAPGRSGNRVEASADGGGERRKGRRNPGDPARKTRKRANAENDAAPE
jgi:HlyD family secretion protein